MNVIEQLGLRQDPFGPASGATGFGVAASLLVAREKLMASIGRGDPLTVLAGRPGMGKTLLLTMVEQAYRADGFDVRSIARGDMAHVALGSRTQLLLIDEADTINTATLKALAPGTASAAAPTMVFAVARPALHRLSSDVRATIIDLRALDPEESRDFLLTRAAQAGRLDLFTPEALEVIVEAGQGSPRLLRVLAGAAMFQAASDGAAQITAAHAGLAAAMHGKLLTLPAAEPALPLAANDLEPEDRPRTVVPLALGRASTYQRAGALSFAASVALAALVLPVFFFPEAADTSSVGVTTANAAQPVSGAAQLPVQLASAFTVAPASAAAPRPPLRPDAKAATALHRVAAVAPPLLAAPSPRIATAAIDTRAVPIRLVEARLVTEGAGVARALRSEVAAGGDRELLIDVLAATRLRPAVVADRESGGGQSPATEAAPTPADDPATLFAALASVIDPPATAPAPAPVVTATFVPLPPVAEPRTAPVAPPALVAVTVAKATADETRTTKLAAQQAKEAARQAEAAQAAADQAKASAEQAKAAKDAADQVKAGKHAADQAKEAAKEAADQAKAAKEAAEQSKAAKAAAEQAKAAKEASDQAKAAKDAADQAKAAKEAAEQAKAAKEAADQAKAVKDAVDQAKAAKDAADQAKAAKEAAEQAKAAKDAVEQAKAAKDAADQAKAAKEAADQAKAAKDAVAQAKAAKDAADQAKEAAKAAKDAAKAAKDAIKAAKEAGKGN